MAIVGLAARPGRGVPAVHDGSRDAADRRTRERAGPELPSRGCSRYRPRNRRCGSTYAVSSGVSFRCRQGVSFECRLTPAGCGVRRRRRATGAAGTGGPSGARPSGRARRRRSGPRVAKVADSTGPAVAGGGLQGCPAGRRVSDGAVVVLERARRSAGASRVGRPEVDVGGRVLRHPVKVAQVCSACGCEPATQGRQASAPIRSAKLYPYVGS